MILMIATCLIQMMKVAMLRECGKCKTSNLDLDDFDEDESENEGSCSDSRKNENSAKICLSKWRRQDGEVLKQYIGMDVADFYRVLEWDNYQPKVSYSFWKEAGSKL